MKKQMRPNTKGNPEWDVISVRVMLTAGILPFVAASDTVPLVKKATSRTGKFELEAVAPLAQRFAFCQWIGIPSDRWEDPWWRDAIVLRYRYGQMPPIDLLDSRWRRRLDVAARTRRESEIPFLDGKALRVPAESPRAARLVAYVYFLSKSEGPIDRHHPLRQPLNRPEFWQLLADRMPHLFTNREASAILIARDDDYLRLAGQLVYYLQGLEQWNEGLTRERFPELEPGGAIPVGVSAEEFYPDDDFVSITNIYAKSIKLPPESALEVLRAWIRFGIEARAREGKGIFNTIHLATSLLEQLQPLVYEEYLRRTHEFHALCLKPLIANPQVANSECSLLQSRLRTFVAALHVNPLLRCVLFTEVHRRCPALRKPTTEGRPAMNVEGQTYAFAVREFRRALGRRRLPKVSKVLAGWKAKSHHVNISIMDTEDVNRVHCLLAPLLAALLGRVITPRQVRELAHKYERKRGRPGSA